jgi:hypothetical protein
MSGGKLIQHVTGHTSTHPIEIIGWGDYNIPSTHHQMMFPYNLSKESYEMIAWSSKFLSDTHLNGKNEEITLPSDFLEPEIIRYLKTKSLCIQGHPELGDSEIQKVTLELIKKFLRDLKNKSNRFEVSLDNDYDYEEAKEDSDWMEEPTPNIGVREGAIKFTTKTSPYEWQDVKPASPIYKSKPSRGMSMSSGIYSQIRDVDSERVTQSKWTVEAHKQLVESMRNQIYSYGTDGLKSKVVYTEKDAEEQLKF